VAEVEEDHLVVEEADPLAAEVADVEVGVAVAGVMAVAEAGVAVAEEEEAA